MSHPGRGNEEFYSKGSRSRAWSAHGQSSDGFVVRVGVSTNNLLGPTGLGSYVLMGSRQLTSSTRCEFQYLQNSTKDMAQNIVLRNMHIDKY